MFDHFENDARLAHLADAVTKAEYALDEAIRANGIGSELNVPFRDRLSIAEHAMEMRMARLDKEAGFALYAAS